MPQAAKLPATLPVLADFFGEYPSQPANELILNADITSTSLSIVATTNIPASWPASGRFVIDGEVIEYASYTSATFTIASTAKRGLETGFGAGAAASHTAGAVIGYYLTAQAVAQLLAEVLAVSRMAIMPAREDWTGAVTVDYSDVTKGYNRYARLTGNVTLTLSNPPTRGTFMIELEQDGTGGRTFAFTTTVKWRTGSAPGLSTTAGKKAILIGVYDGTDWLWDAAYDY